MSDKSNTVDSGPIEAGTEVEQRKRCYRCGNLCHKSEMALGEYLCASCFADLQELGRACSQSDGVKSKGTRVYRITSGNELFWAMYNPTNGDDIKEIARNFELNLIPVNVWEIQVQQKTSYLLVIGNITERSAPLIMKKIDPQAPTPNFKRIVDGQTQNHIAGGRAISEFILGKPCGNRLEMTFHEFVEIMVYASDLEEAGLSRVEIIEKVLTRFYVSDPITRRAALIGLICGPTPDFQVGEGSRAGS